jgi:hypothetical protein
MSESQSPSLQSPETIAPAAARVNQNVGDKSARLILSSSFALFAVYIVVVCFDSFPVRLLDPVWIITASSSFANVVTIPIAGVGLAHVAAALAPLDATIDQRRRWISRLSALAALGFLLMVPLLGFATWRGISNVNLGAKLQAEVFKRDAGKLIEAINQSSSPQELQKKMVALQGPRINDRDLVRPLAELKQTQKQIIKLSVQNLIGQIPSPTSENYRPLYRQALRSALLSLVSSIAFAALAWDPLKQQSLLQLLFAKTSYPKPNGFLLLIKMKIVELKRSNLVASNKSEASVLARRWQRESQREAIRRQRDAKRNHEIQRKAAAERDRKQAQAERQAKKERKN